MLSGTYRATLFPKIYFSISILFFKVIDRHLIVFCKRSRPILWREDTLSFSEKRVRKYPSLTMFSLSFSLSLLLLLSIYFPLSFRLTESSLGFSISFRKLADVTGVVLSSSDLTYLRSLRSSVSLEESFLFK